MTYLAVALAVALIVAVWLWVATARRLVLAEDLRAQAEQRAERAESTLTAQITRSYEAQWALAAAARTHPQAATVAGSEH